MSAVAEGARHRWRASPAAAILTIVGATLLAGFVLAAIFAPVLAPFDPAGQVGAPFESPSIAHPLGTDDIGQDLLSQLIYGARVSLAVGIGAAVIATVVATAAGLVAGFLRGWVDVLFIRVADVMLALPVLPLLLVLSAFLQPGRAVQAVTIGLILSPRAAREIRARVLTVSRLGPVDAARSMGASASHLLYRHLFPGTAAIVVAQFVRAVAGAIAFESSLSFLGLGDPTSRSWGTILFFANARGAFFSSAWLWWVIPPGACIGLTVVAFAFLGFGLEERSDPRLRASLWRLTSGRRLRHGGPATAAGRGPLLVVDNLSIDYGRRDAVRALAGVSFSVESGNLVVVTGASGSGKSTLAGAIMGMVRSPGRIVSGSVLFEGRDLAQLSAVERRRLRGLGIALVPQAAMNALHPALTVAAQVAEAIHAHQRMGRAAARDRAGELLLSVGVPPERLNAFPHQLSGGMRQRVAIAMAIANEPRLIVADEPTTGLDVIAQVEVIDLLGTLRARSNAAMIIITHDPPAMLTRLADVITLASGRIIPPAAVPPAGSRATPAEIVTTLPLAVAADVAPLLRVSKVHKSFPSGGRGHREEVLRGVDLRVNPAEIVGLIGRSGTGKTTLARVIAGLTRPEAGAVMFNGRDLLAPPGRGQRAARRELQMVGQDPYGWLSPRMSVRQLVAEPLAIHGTSTAREQEERIRQALAEVELQPVSRYIDRYPHELSGGERQRVALARAIVLAPALIVADEPTSMLDADLRRELTALMNQLRERRHVAYLYITHDITLARRICDRINVMDEGRIVEECLASELGLRDHHAATQRLLDAANVLNRL